MSNPATVDDVAALRYWRPLSDLESSGAAVLLEHAWSLVLGRRPLLDSWVTAGSVSEANVRRVLASMVVRVLENPQGKSEESIDDYRYKRDSLISAGVLSVTSDELADLTPATAGSRRRSVRLVTHGDL